MPAMKWEAIYRLIRRLPVPRGVRLSLFEKAMTAQYRGLIKAAESSNPRGDVAGLREEHRHERHMLYEDREVMYTNRLLRAARRLRVQTPIRYSAAARTAGDYTDDWQQSYDGEMYLSEQGEAKVRAAIREERLARAEVRTHWITWVTAITGLLGTLTGLLAVAFSRQ
jgi:hypothetical protein